MSNNTVKSNDGVEVYTSNIYRLADEYIDSLDNPDDIKGFNKGLFTGMLKHIYIHCFMSNKPNYDDIELLDSIFNIYTSLCYKYNKRPTILGYSLMTGIDNTTINTWKNGTYRGGLGSPHSKTSKKWFAECENALVDGAIEQNGIGCIFALKANYGYTETAPAQVPYSGDQRKSIEQIAQEHGIAMQIEDNQKDIADVPEADF